MLIKLYYINLREDVCIMKLLIDSTAETPIYQQIIDGLKRAIQSGILPPGSQLPTVRELAEENLIARGTVKHAYDMLELEGLIKKQQGKGTFVYQQPEEKTLGKKEQATLAMDRLLEQLEELGFSLRDIRIILDLKLREREESYRHVRIGAVDCSPEALSVIMDQLAGFPGADVFEYLLQPILDSPSQFNPGWDIYITTPTHYQELSEKMPAGSRLIQVVLSVSAETILELARIPREKKVGILCSSRRFGDIIKRACRRYCRLDQEPQVYYFGDPEAEATAAFLKDTEQLILPLNYLRFSSAREQNLLAQYTANNKPVIFQYQMEQGSLLYLAEQIQRVRSLIRGLE